jgi:hypothetical protein
MLGHYALTDKVFDTPGWSKVVMVEPTGMKPVKLIGAEYPAASSPDTGSPDHAANLGHGRPLRPPDHLVAVAIRLTE